MYFSKKIIYILTYRQLKVTCCFFILNCNNLFFPSSHHFEKAKTPIECIFDEDKEYLFNFDWIEKKEVIMTKRRQIAIKLLSSNMPIYMYFIVGFFLHQYQPLKIKSISLSDLNFENRSGIRIKLWIELCPSNFHLYYSCWALL